VVVVGGWNGSTFIPDIDVLECDPEQMAHEELCRYAFDNELFSGMQCSSSVSFSFMLCWKVFVLFVDNV
jgi:hypothetical protein